MIKSKPNQNTNQGTHQSKQRVQNLADKKHSHNLWSTLRIGRRITQIISLSLFLWLILATASYTGAKFDAQNSGIVPYPVEAFLDIDPLISLIVAFSTHSVPFTLFFGLIVLSISFFLGRIFCGWICPMGTMNHGISDFRLKKRRKQKTASNNRTRYQKVKYLILITILTSAIFGSAWGGLLDPISIATRGIALTVLPWIEWLLGGVIQNAANSNTVIFQHLSDMAYDASGGMILHQEGLLVGSGLIISIFFITILVANRFIPKFWCRYLCPLGALLGISGRFGFLSLHKDELKCTNCGACDKVCVGDASPMPGEKWQRSECELCLNCVAVCKKDAISFGFVKKEQVADRFTEQSYPDLKRRHIISSAAIGAALIPALRTGGLSTVDGRPDPACIRPPGAVNEKEFLKRCIRCGQCMKICPNNALHPALDEAGLEGLWTPILVPKVGYCEPTCTLCSQVCPTAAIKQVLEDQKTGKNNTEMLRIGTAFFDRGRCLPWAMGTSCTVCEEFCPISPKAIYLENVEKEINGKTVKLKIPYINPHQCNGCGACETVCPVNDKAAIRVSCAGESRNPNNKLLLGK